MLPGIRIRRQIGGFVLRSVTFRLSTSAAAGFFSGAGFTKVMSRLVIHRMPGFCGMAATTASNQAAPFGAGGRAVSVLRGVVVGDRIDAEFLSDMGELFRVHETAVCHHRAQGR